MDCKGCENSMSSVMRDYVGVENAQRLLQFLVRHKIINDVYLCSICNNMVQAKWKKGTQIVFECNKGHPRRNISAKTGTFIGDTHLSPDKVVKFCIMWCILPNPRFKVMQFELKCTAKTVVDWSNYCRDICINWVLQHQKRIGGTGRVVEMEELKFGGKFRRGDRVEEQWVFGGVQRDDKSNFFLVPFERREKENVFTLIQDWILPGTTIISNCWKSYDIFQDETFQQLQVNYSLQLVSTYSGGEGYKVKTRKLGGQLLPIHTNTIKSTFRDCKYSIPAFGRRKEHFAGYLAEYLFKRNYSCGERLHYLLLEAAKNYPPEV